MTKVSDELRRLRQLVSKIEDIERTYPRGVTGDHIARHDIAVQIRRYRTQTPQPEVKS